MLDIAVFEAHSKDNDKPKIEIVKKQTQPIEEDINPKNRMITHLENGKEIQLKN